MTGVQILPQTDGTHRYRVLCAEHGLDRTVDTPAHAANLEALHQHRDHPPEDALDLLAAAASVVAYHALGGSIAATAVDVWANLTGRDRPDALEYARAIVLGESNDTHAAVIPL